MGVPFGGIVWWLKAIALIFASFRRSGKQMRIYYCKFVLPFSVTKAQLVLLFSLFSISEAFSWTREPHKPTIVIEDGVNNKNVRLVWEFVLAPNENAVAVYIQREDLDGGNRVDIASRQISTAFVYPVNTDFHEHYRAQLPAQLVILNVDNTKEYKYGVRVTYSSSGSSVSATSTVHVKVYGK